VAFCLILHTLNVAKVELIGQGLQGRLGGSVGEGGASCQVYGRMRRLNETELCCDLG
jgi:hypothetical protein